MSAKLFKFLSTNILLYITNKKTYGDLGHGCPCSLVTWETTSSLFVRTIFIPVQRKLGQKHA